MIESLPFLQSIGAVTFGFLGTISRISVIICFALSQAVKLPFYPRVIGQQVLEFGHFSTLKWGVMPFAHRIGQMRMAAVLEIFKMIRRKVSNPVGIRFVNFTTIFRQAIGALSLFANENLHHSSEVLTRWAKTIIPLAETAWLKEKIL